MKILYPLLLLVPVVLVLEWTGVENHTLMFVLSALALVPLSAVLGGATERVSEYTGPKIGGFLNATFGNAPELIITIVALREGLVDVVKASIAGSIIGNILVVLGASILLGGLKHGEQRFDVRLARTNASMMSLAIVILMIPAVFELGSDDKGPTHGDIVNLSDGAAIILIVLYGLYLVSTLSRKVAHRTSPMSPRWGNNRGVGSTWRPARCWPSRLPSWS